MLEQVENVFTILGIVVSASTMIVAGLEKVASITPSTRDDEVVSKVKKVLVTVVAVLDKVSVWTSKPAK